MSRVRECFHAIPFNSTWQASTVGFLQASLERYSFLDLFAASTLPYQYRHDAAAKLAAAASAPFRGDYEFQEAVAAPIRAFQDRHTVYLKPQCYAGFAFLPLAPVVALDSATGELQANVQALSVAGTSVTSALSPGLSARIGWRVATIDGVEAVAAIHNFAEQFSVHSNDAAARFTGAARELSFSARSLQLLPLPERDNSTLVLINPESGASEQVVVPQQVVRIHDSLAEDGVSVSIIQRADAPPVVLLRLSTFNPPYVAECFESFGDSLCASAAALAEAEACFASAMERFFARTVTTPAEAALAYHAHQLIIDLTGNRGGNVLLGQLFAAYNFAALQRQPLAAGATMRFRISPSLSDMAAFIERKKAESGAASLQDVLPGFSLLGVQVLQPKEGQAEEDAAEMTSSASLASFQWYKSGSTAQFGAGPVRVSDAIRLANLATMVDSSAQLARGVVWNETNTVVISDLLCGSMCAQVVHTVKEHGQARVIGVGGLGALQGDTTAFAGGFIVSDAEAVVAQGRALADLGYEGPVAPLPETSAAFSFNEAMAMSHSRRQTPMQFAPVTADARIYDWSSGGATLDVQLEAARRALDGEPSALAGLSTHEVLLYSLGATCLLMLVTLVLCGAHIRTSGRVWARCPMCMGVCCSGNHRKVSTDTHAAIAEQVDLDRVLSRDRRAAHRRAKGRRDDSLRGLGKHHSRTSRKESRRRSRSSGRPSDADRGGHPGAMRGGRAREGGGTQRPSAPGFALASSVDLGAAYSTPDPGAAEAPPEPPSLALEPGLRSARGSGDARSDSKVTPNRARQDPMPAGKTLVEEMLAASDVG
ncbi:hypothetical protein FNF27_00840 [Cafeteria roenbergensis]|uniref:Tail specific protease domain-containing protein n=1 Tax=Cafeteria roenbergensis TaxID=33653 RepID=A0A5A8ELZ6_CAFRO|nr:hypothetical protein FNF27_00840 [Cafeteria roenbergensis]